MNNWWERKKNRTRKHQKHSEDDSFWSFLLDVLFWIPELILVPFRILFWLLRGLGRWIGDVW